MINIDVLKGSTVFTLCVIGLGISACCQKYLSAMLAEADSDREGVEAMKELMDGTEDLEVGQKSGV